jgi:hypothetical protein
MKLKSQKNVCSLPDSDGAVNEPFQTQRNDELPVQGTYQGVGLMLL